ncbi:MAG TPA: PEGA domain-containing protein, partial [Kofleriaceae bacterium]|nr:PEGA domain-containing protein [Kofleriaceae bacterium]
DPAMCSHHTRTGSLIGTPYYMSPEQCDGRGNIDHRTDIYALGIVLYEMLTGRVPFRGDGDGEVLIQQMASPPLAPTVLTPQIPEPIELVVLKALEKSANHRYQRMADVRLALQDPVQWIERHGGRSGFLASPVLRDLVAAGSGTTTALRTAEATTTLGGTAVQMTAIPSVRQGMRVRAGLGLAATIAVSGAMIGVAARRFDDRPGSIATFAGARLISTPIAAKPASTVRVTIDSRPQGATVIIGGQTRGVTPYIGDLDRNGGQVELELTLPGYAPEIRSVVLTDDIAWSVSLDRAQLAPRAAMPATEPRLEAQHPTPPRRQDSGAGVEP